MLPQGLLGGEGKRSDRGCSCEASGWRCAGTPVLSGTSVVHRGRYPGQDAALESPGEGLKAPDQQLADGILRGVEAG